MLRVHFFSFLTIKMPQTLAALKPLTVSKWWRNWKMYSNYYIKNC